MVATAPALAFNDAATTGKLHPLTRQALDKMWTLQREDGGFTWIKCDWPPMESDDHYGATLVAIAVGRAPDGYAQTAAAMKGMEKLKVYLKNNPGPTLHHRARVLWGALKQGGNMLPDRGQETVTKALGRHRPGGGWGWVQWETGLIAPGQDLLRPISRFKSRSMPKDPKPSGTMWCLQV